MLREVRSLMHDLFVPLQSKPSQPLEDAAGALIGAARAVSILDAQQELAAVVLDEEPIEESRTRNADV